IGAGAHEMISEKPYLFKRTFSKEEYADVVLIGLDLSKGKKTLDVSNVFENRVILYDAYSDNYAKVKEGKITIESTYNIVLLEISNH
ncbi:MAG: alpha-amylase, partial [Flavobacteriaceae bacterium]|nr:alpha-amylase [Flavobacteriaceae bacterium]